MRHGYEPSRIANLTQQSRSAVGALDGIHSTDPAAAEAMAAVAGLKSVIADGLIPATTAVGLVDPLGRNGTQVSAVVGADWYADWLTNLVVTDYSDMTDDELFAELVRLEENLPYDENFRPDMDDPLWIEFEQLAIELAVRAETSDAFAERLAAEAVDTFLIPFALRFARFDPELVADMLLTVSEWPAWSVDLQSTYRTVGAGLLVDFLADFPAIALEILLDPEADKGDEIALLEDLLRWPGLDQDAVGRFLDAAMASPFDQVDLLAQAGAILQQLIEIANGKSFPDGFPIEASPVLAKIIVQYLPFFVTSLNERGDVHLKDFDLQDMGIELGSYGDVLDLLGVLLRDPASLEILLGVIPTLTVLGQDEGGALDVNLDDVANYLQALRKAAENEQLEEAIEAARDREAADLTIDLIFGAVDLITSVTGPLKVAGVAVPISVIKDGAKLFAEWAITATELGLDGVATIAYLLMAYGISVAIVRDRVDQDDQADEVEENIRLAEKIIDDIEEALDAGKSIGEVEGLIGDLRRVAAAIDNEKADILNDRRVVPPAYDVEENVDTEN